MKKFKVENFFYDGLFIQRKKGNAKYTAEFKKWTEDPGIVICQCSDGKERLIPSCCLIGFKKEDFPKQPELKERNLGLVHIGQPSKS